MMIDRINKVLKDKKKYLGERFSVQSIGIFGSYIRNESWLIREVRIVESVTFMCIAVLSCVSRNNL